MWIYFWRDEKIGQNDEALNQYKIIYREDVGFRDVGDKIEASYHKDKP